jgi:hypothetical protein
MSTHPYNAGNQAFYEGLMLGLAYIKAGGQAQHVCTIVQGLLGAAQLIAATQDRSRHLPAHCRETSNEAFSAHILLGPTYSKGAEGALDIHTVVQGLREAAQVIKGNSFFSGQGRRASLKIGTAFYRRQALVALHAHIASCRKVAALAMATLEKQLAFRPKAQRPQEPGLIHMNLSAGAA